MNRFVTGILIIVSAVPAMLSGGCGHDSVQSRNDGTELMLHRMQAVDKLTLAQMRVTKMATIDDIPIDSARGARQVVAALLDAVKVGDRKAAYSYDTYLSAYIDMSEITEADLNVDEESKRVRITLPKPEVELAGRDMEIREEHYRVTGLRTAIGPAERVALKEKMNSSLKEEISADNEFSDKLTETARRRGEIFFKELLGDLGYTVSVEWRDGRADVSGPASGFHQ